MTKMASVIGAFQRYGALTAGDLRDVTGISLPLCYAYLHRLRKFGRITHESDMPRGGRRGVPVKLWRFSSTNAEASRG